MAVRVDSYQDKGVGFKKTSPPRSYQERALPTELCGPLTLCKVEGVGFEPTQPVRAADLQSAPINHSGTPPWHNSIKKCLKNLAREGSRTHQPTDYKSVALPLSYSGDL
jgi:hypothetical protein